MSFFQKLIGFTSGNGAEVDTNNQLKVVTSNVPAQTGTYRSFHENDPGSITGNVYLKSPEVSMDFRTRVGLDSVWDTERFNYAAQNTSKYNYTNTTMTITYGGSSITTNGGAITTLNTGAFLRSYKYFPMQGTGTLYVDFSMGIIDAIATNSTVDFGLFVPGSAITDPTDGVYFRISSAGVIGVINNVGVETTTSVLGFTNVINSIDQYIICISRESVEFWINNILYAKIATPAGQGSPIGAYSLPLCIQHRILGVAAGSTFRTRFFGYNVTLGDLTTNRPWSTSMSGQGLSAIQGASGFTQGQTANYANSAAPASATLSNTAAGYTTMGGQFQFVAVAGAETDYALFGYQVTTPNALITGRSLMIRGIWIDTFNMGAAVATSPTLLQWSIGVGATAVSLATAEAATTRAARRLTLGTQSLAVGTPVGGQANQRIDVNLDAPLQIEPGTFLHVILKMPVGTATASQIIRGVVGVNAFWE